MTDTTEMTETTDIATRLRLERDAIETTTSDDGLHNVRRIVRRRRRRTTFVGVAAASGLVAGVVAVAAIDQNPTDVLVSNAPPSISAAAVPEPSSRDAGLDASEDDRATIGPNEATPVAPSIGAPAAGVAVSQDLVPITDGLRAVAGDAASFDFEVPWRGGFLVGRSGSASDPWEAYFSPDGRTWERRDIDPGITASFGVVASTGGRLVVIGTGGEEFPLSAGESPPSASVVASTTDLVNWTRVKIPVEVPSALPAIITTFNTPPTIAVNENGWTAAIDRSLQINPVELAAQRLGRPVTSVSTAFSDEEMRIVVDPVDPGGEVDELIITWDELEAELGADLVEAVRRPSPPEVWSGSWTDSTPARHDVASVLADSWLEDIVAVQDGFVMVRSRQEPRDDAPVEVTMELVVGSDDQWTVLAPPIPESVVAAFPLDDDLGVLARADDGSLSVYRVDIVAQSWTPVDVPDLPARARSIETAPTGVIVLDIAPEPVFDVGPTTGTFEQNGLRYTWTFEFPNSSYEVTSIKTGEVLVAESIDIGEVTGSFELAFEYLIGGIDDTRITDPETGAVLMEFTAEEREAAAPSEIQEPEWPEPEPWILATADGVAWFVAEFPPSSPETSLLRQLTVSGGRLLVDTGGNEWFVVDLE